MHLYLHIPFCRRRCSYCDFQIAVRKDIPAGAFTRDLLAELRLRGLQADPLATLYLGGGTPSLLPAAFLGEILAAIPRQADAEVTLEANPEDVTPDAAAGWHRAGINRVSLGVQTFEPAVLTWMRRPHGPDAPGRAMHVLREAGIGNVSVDLIFGVPAALDRDLARDLDRLLALEPDHVSAYGLTVEPRTPLGRWVRSGAVEPIADEPYEAEFFATREALTQAGYEHYEVSNYAREGKHARHNRAYWSGVPYAGAGPGAHGFAGDERRWNLGSLRTWSAAVRSGRDPVEGRERLTDAARRLETVYLGLRTTAGLAERDPALAADQVEPMVARGWLVRNNGRLWATPAGWLRLDAIAPRLTTSPGGG